MDSCKAFSFGLTYGKGIRDDHVFKIRFESIYNHTATLCGSKIYVIGGYQMESEDERKEGRKWG